MQLSILVSSDYSTGSYLKDKEKILRTFVRRSVNSSKRVRRSFAIFLDDMTHNVVEERHVCGRSPSGRRSRATVARDKKEQSSR